MNKEFDLLIFIGRFAPFHMEHKRIVDIALTKAKNVLVLVGSSGKARTIRNPFTFEERVLMIRDSIEFDAGQLIVKPLYDKTYNDDAWIKQVQEVVNQTALGLANNGGFPIHGLADMKIGLIGASKDNTSYYLKLFPQWGSVNVDIKNPLHATAIREGFLAGTLQKHEISGNEVTPEVATFLYRDFKPSEVYAQLQSELNHVKLYKKQWEAAPYPVKHVTVDSVVTQSGHVLLVKRRSEPGKGLWALPGGHLEVDERIIDGIIRELKEETMIKVPEAVLRGSIVDIRVYDDPHRSTIGRIITHAAHIKLKDDVKLPKVKGSDDAEKAKWIPIGDLREDALFDDHFHIVNDLLNGI